MAIQACWWPTAYTSYSQGHGKAHGGSERNGVGKGSNGVSGKVEWEAEWGGGIDSPQQQFTLGSCPHSLFPSLSLILARCMITGVDLRRPIGEAETWGGLHDCPPPAGYSPSVWLYWPWRSERGLGSKWVRDFDNDPATLEHTKVLLKSQERVKCALNTSKWNYRSLEMLDFGWIVVLYPKISRFSGIQI